MMGSRQRFPTPRPLLAAKLLLLLAAGMGPMGMARGQDPFPPSPNLPVELASEPEAYSPEQSRRFLADFCLDCHSGAEPEAELNLEKLLASDTFAQGRDHWIRSALRVRSGEMPPKNSRRPEAQARVLFAQWAENSVHEAVCGDGVDLDPAPLRRLNRAEYSTTLQELLGIAFDAGAILPSEGAGGEGFDNAAETLFLSPIHAEKFISASREALNYAVRDPVARNKVITTVPGEEKSPEQAARQVLDQFLPRSYRRPVSADEVDDLLPLFVAAQARGESYDQSVIAMLQGALVSPHFIFRIEDANEGSQPRQVNSYEMATRLSYFLWGGMPDAELFALARDGKLQDPEVLQAQTLRMLKDARVHNFAERFIGQWLGTRSLGVEFQPDPKFIAGYDTELEWAIKNEPVLFFRELLAQNESLMNLLDSEFSFLNEKLRRLYGVRVGSGQNLLRVKLPEDSHRGGVLTMAAVLAVTSYPHRTSPVLRGKWVLETILGAPPPPPPPNVPELAEKGASGQPATLRERLEVHRQDPVCASCHNSIDPLGFGLDNFDLIGRWRSENEGQPINAAGQLPDGTTFSGPDELKEVLLARKDQFARHLTRQVFAYALGRGLTVEDECVVDDITKKLQADNFRAQTLILQIVLSDPMRMQPPALPIRLPQQPAQGSP